MPVMYSLLTADMYIVVNQGINNSLFPLLREYLDCNASSIIKKKVIKEQFCLLHR